MEISSKLKLFILFPLSLAMRAWLFNGKEGDIQVMDMDENETMFVQ